MCGRTRDRQTRTARKHKHAAPTWVRLMGRITRKGGQVCKTHKENGGKGKRGKASWRLAFKRGAKGVWEEWPYTCASVCAQVSVIQEESGSCSFQRNNSVYHSKTNQTRTLGKQLQQVTGLSCFAFLLDERYLRVYTLLLTDVSVQPGPLAVQFQRNTQRHILIINCLAN